ncbi:hypothetical protein [Hydrogenimonas sp.]
MRKIALFSLFFAFFSSIAAETASPPSSEADATLVDRLHGYLSDTVVDLSESLDTTLAGALGEKENEEAKKRAMQKERERSDAFFQTRRYLNETARTYVRLRASASLQSLGDDATHFNVRAHLPLNRVRRRLRLFVEDVNEENADNLVKRTDETGTTDTGRPVDTSPKFGLNYFAPRAFGIRSKYSLGLSGLHPYVRARYSYFHQAGRWMIEPVQTLQYSEKYDFSEHTSLYFDTEPAPDTLFRIQFDRGTQAHEKGMYYGAGVGYYWTLSRHTGMRLVQTFRGDTGYEYTPEGENETRRFKGIYSYTTAFGYRRSFWRPWLFVEVIPAVNFSRTRDYDPNYTVTVLVDMFIGNY